MTGSYHPVKPPPGSLTLTVKAGVLQQPPPHTALAAGSSRRRAAPLLLPSRDTPGYPGPAPVGPSSHLKSAQSPRTQRPGGSSPPRVASSQGTCGGRRGWPGPGAAGVPHGGGGEGGAAAPAQQHGRQRRSPRRGGGVRPGPPWLPPVRERRIARHPLAGGGGGASHLIGFCTHPSRRRGLRG